MNAQRLSVTSLVFGFGLAITASATLASPITIDNYSFENATGLNTGAQAVTPSDWQATGIVDNQSQFANADMDIWLWVRNHALTNRDGLNCMEILISTSVPLTGPVSVALSTNSLGTYQANTVYTLTVGVGTGAVTDLEKAGLALAANGSVVVSDIRTFTVLTGGVNIGRDILNDVQLVLDTAAHPEIVGQNISVQLSHTVLAGIKGNTAYFDNVRLDAVSSNVPEPASMALLAIGGLMMARRRSMK